MILKDEQIAERVKEYILNIHKGSGKDMEELTVVQLGPYYSDGWKECTEHYKELIEAGMKWKELMIAVEDEQKDNSKLEPTDALRENIGWHVLNIMYGTE